MQEIVAAIADAHARDLAAWCLNALPSRRPRGFDSVLQHPFLAADGQGALQCTQVHCTHELALKL